jgi:hypothetical protein
MGNAQADHRTEAIRAQQSRMPRDRRAPIVPGNHRLIGTQRIKEAHHIADEMKQRVLVDSLRPVGLAVAAHIGRNGVESGRRQGGKLMPPRVPGLRKSVTQNNERPLALLGDMQMNAARFDHAMCHTAHGHLSLPCVISLLGTIAWERPYCFVVRRRTEAPITSCCPPLAGVGPEPASSSQSFSSPAEVAVVEPPRGPFPRDGRC